MYLSFQTGINRTTSEIYFKITQSVAVCFSAVSTDYKYLKFGILGKIKPESLTSIIL